MNATKWTPGPTPLTEEWLNQFCKSSQIIRTQRDDKGNWYNNLGVLNQATWFGEYGHLLIDEVNRLRAAAPELVEALEACLGVIDAYIDTDAIVNADIVQGVRDARAALAKAKGEA